MRKNLHSLFNRRLDTLHPRQRRSAIEAPIALALEAVARNEVSLERPTNLLLLTGVHPSLELTAVTLSLAGMTLKASVTAYATIDPADIPGSLRDFGESPVPSRLFHSGIAEMAQSVAIKLGRDPSMASLVDLGKHATAIGAVRHGGLLEKQFWLGHRVNQLEVVRIAPVALGVVGQIDPVALGIQGAKPEIQWCWRCLLEKGGPLPTSPSRADLIVPTPSPGRIALAECPSREFAARRWLGQEDWLNAGLRWHDVITVTPNYDACNLQYKMAQTRKKWNTLSYVGWEVVSAGSVAEGTPSITT